MSTTIWGLTIGYREDSGDEGGIMSLHRTLYGARDALIEWSKERRGHDISALEWRDKQVWTEDAHVSITEHELED